MYKSHSCIYYLYSIKHVELMISEILFSHKRTIHVPLFEVTLVAGDSLCSLGEGTSSHISSCKIFGPQRGDLFGWHFNTDNLICLELQISYHRSNVVCYFNVSHHLSPVF